MDTSDPKITFDGKGRCDHCNTFYKSVLPKWQPNEAGRKILEKKIEQKRPMSPGFVEGYRVQVLLDAVRRSHDAGRWLDTRPESGP